jgi:DnaJ-class molecular chaperone
MILKSISHLNQRLLFQSLRLFSSGFKEQYDPQNDLYSVLGVSPEIDAKKMKLEYYKLAQKYHPDKNPGHGEKFKLITNAYDVLKNQETKSSYDQARK